MITLLLNIIVVIFVGLIIDYSYTNLRNENKTLRKDIDELQYKLLTYEMVEYLRSVIKD